MQNVYNNCSASCAIHIINLPSPRGSISTCWYTRRSRPKICRARNWQNYPRRWKPSFAQDSRSWCSNRNKKRNKDYPTCRRLRANHRHIFFPITGKFPRPMLSHRINYFLRNTKKHQRALTQLHKIQADVREKQVLKPSTKYFAKKKNKLSNST